MTFFFLVVAEPEKSKLKVLSEGSLGLAGAHILLGLHMAERPLSSHFTGTHLILRDPS